MRLSDFGANTYSQFGEDGIVAQIFSLIGETSRVCVEFGAADGLSCSNTRVLWEAGWSAILVEGSPERFSDLVKNVAWNCTSVQRLLQPTGPDSIDSVLRDVGVKDVDFMSVDVDGIDYQIWQNMRVRPRVLCIEYNQSIPPHSAVWQHDEGDYFGASARALVDLGIKKKYRLVGLTPGNLFFVQNADAPKFAKFDTDLSDIFLYDALTHIATDYAGHPFVVGEPPWGLLDLPFTDKVNGDGIHYLGSHHDIIRTFEDQVGSVAAIIGQDWEVAPNAETEITVAAFSRFFGFGNPLVVIDVANQPDISVCYWVGGLAERFGYKMRVIEERGLLIFTKGNS